MWVNWVRQLKTTVQFLPRLWDTWSLGRAQPRGFHRRLRSVLTYHLCLLKAFSCGTPVYTWCVTEENHGWILCECVYVYIFSCMGPCVYSWWRPELNNGLTIDWAPLYLLRQSFSLGQEPTDLHSLFSQLAMGIPCLCLPKAVLSGGQPCLPGFYICAEDPNFSPHTDAIATIILETSPQPMDDIYGLGLEGKNVIDLTSIAFFDYLPSLRCLVLFLRSMSDFCQYDAAWGPLFLRF